MAKILIVDDDRVLTRLYKSAFEAGGFEVETAVDGEEGFTKAKSFKPSFIISDVMMPRADWIEMLKNLKKTAETKEIPVMLMTNLRDDENAETAQSLGVLKMIIKEDYGAKDIVVAVNKILKESKGD
jgi:two-component system alkaline phosphatase synthesis response regulator PhoP